MSENYHKNDSELFVSVVIPVFNENTNIKILIERLKSTLSIYSTYEVIFVDDGSSDDSGDIIVSHCVKNKSIKLISLSRNFGHQLAISAGIANATGDVVIVMDGDLQDPPEVIPDFINKWKEGWDVVYAVRKKRKENIFKKTAYFIFYRILKALAPFEIPLDSGDFALMDKKVVAILQDFPERNRFVRGLRSWVGLKQTGLEYERAARFSGTPKFTLAKLMKLAYDGLTSFSDVPLKLAMTLGISFTFLAFVAIVILTILKLSGGVELEGWTSLMVVILFVSGLQFILIGILGEYIGRIFEEVKKRPQYLIADKINIK
jgi:polyisoprenyl-phosphate glycosyltransferase